MSARYCGECGASLEGCDIRALLCSPACRRARNRKQVRSSYRRARGYADERARPCQHCGGQIVDTQRIKYCGPECEVDGRRAMDRAKYARHVAAKGTTYKPSPGRRAKVGAELHVRPDELDGHRPCGNSSCGRFVTPEEAICGDCLPRFDAPPRPRRASDEEIAAAMRSGMELAEVATW